MSERLFKTDDRVQYNDQPAPGHAACFIDRLQGKKGVVQRDQLDGHSAVCVRLEGEELGFFVYYNLTLIGDEIIAAEDIQKGDKIEIKDGVAIKLYPETIRYYNVYPDARVGSDYLSADHAQAAISGNPKASVMLKITVSNKPGSKPIIEVL